MKVYIDTCIFSRLLDLRIKKKELIALELMTQNSSIEFMTSEKTLEEFLNTKDDKRRLSLKILFRLINKVQSHNTSYEEPALFGNIMFGEAPWGGSVTRYNPIFEKLETIFDKDDADHIFQAISNDCDYFITLDKKTILSKVDQNEDFIKEFTRLQIVSPVQLNNN